MVNEIKEYIVDMPEPIQNLDGTFCACTKRNKGVYQRHLSNFNAGCAYHQDIWYKIKNNENKFNINDPIVKRWWKMHLPICSNPSKCFFNLSLRYG